MTAINAVPGLVEKKSASGIRPFDIGKDLRPVAELIAEAFANELDPRGNAALREMRMMSHAGGFLKVLNRTTGEFDDVFSGFVWVEDGRLVGNVTVQRADKYGSRWQIANVAVSPSYRGRGIARHLMERAVEHVEDSNGRWTVLQVYAKNDTARRLYETMGFEYLGGKSELLLRQVPPSAQLPDLKPHIPSFYPFASQHAQELYELANCQHHAQAQWWRAIRRSDFQVGFDQQIGEWFARMVGRRKVFRRCVQITRRFEAALMLTVQCWNGDHQLHMWVRPDNYGKYEDAFLSWVLHQLRDYPRYPVTLELLTEHGAAIEAAQTHGFEVTRTLLTMRRKVDNG